MHKVLFLPKTAFLFCDLLHFQWLWATALKKTAPAFRALRAPTPLHASHGLAAPYSYDYSLPPIEDRAHVKWLQLAYLQWLYFTLCVIADPLNCSRLRLLLTLQAGPLDDRFCTASGCTTLMTELLTCSRLRRLPISFNLIICGFMNTFPLIKCAHIQILGIVNWVEECLLFDIVTNPKGCLFLEYDQEIRRRH